MSFHVAYIELIQSVTGEGCFSAAFWRAIRDLRFNSFYFYSQFAQGEKKFNNNNNIPNLSSE